jgi:L-fuconolactonase
LFEVAAAHCEIVGVVAWVPLDELYPPGSSWTSGDLEEVAEFAFGLFGPERLMFGSDWPVAELSGGYAKVRTELSRLFAQLPADGRDAVLGGTAARFYALRAPSG